MHKILSLLEKKRIKEKFMDDSFLETLTDTNYYGVIYKISNDVNDLVYIGKTRRFSQRVTEHIRGVLNPKYEFRSSKILYQSMRKIGLSHFKMEIIDVAYSAEELAEKEVRYIVDFKSILPEFGYNTTVDRMKYLFKDESKIKKSLSHIGKKHTKSIRKKKSNPIIAVNITAKLFIYSDSGKLFSVVFLNGIDRSIVSASLKHSRIINDYYLLYTDTGRIQERLDSLRKLDCDPKTNINDRITNYILLYEMLANKNVENIEKLFKIRHLCYSDDTETGYAIKELSRVCEINEHRSVQTTKNIK